MAKRSPKATLGSVEADAAEAIKAEAGPVRKTNKAMMTPNSKDFDDAKNNKKHEYETLEDGMIIRDPSGGDQRYFGEEVEVDGEKQFVPGVKKGFKLQLTRKEAEFLQSRDIRIGRVKKEGVKQFAPEDASFKGAPEPEEV